MALVLLNSLGDPPASIVAIDDEPLRRLHTELDRKGGLIVLAGPTWSGKNPVAYHSLRRAAVAGGSVSTIELVHWGTIPGVDHYVDDERGPEMSTWKRIVQQPSLDMLYVREMRDIEQLNLVFDAASRRRTKFLTATHTTGAAATIGRYRHLRVENWRTAAAVRLIQAQRCVRRLCHLCREEVNAPPGVFEKAGMSRPPSVFQPAGCPTCHGTGYFARVVVVEQLFIDERLARMIVDGARVEEILAATDFKPLRRSALELAAAGETSLVEALSNA